MRLANQFVRARSSRFMIVFAAGVVHVWTFGQANGVDESGRIAGLDGLAVVDASVLPNLLPCSPSLSLAALALMMTGALL